MAFKPAHHRHTRIRAVFPSVAKARDGRGARASKRVLVEHNQREYQERHTDHLQRHRQTGDLRRSTANQPLRVANMGAMFSVLSPPSTPRLDLEIAYLSRVEKQRWNADHTRTDHSSAPSSPASRPVALDR